MKNLLRAVCAFAATCALAHATQISDRLPWANGSYPSGTITISWPTFMLNGVTTVAGGNIVTHVTAGVVNVSLQPYAGYTATYSLSPGPQGTYTEYWAVPNSATSLTIAQVRTNVLPTPSLIVQLPQLAQDGATNGQCLEWSQTTGSWYPAACITGSGGGGGTWGTITGTLSAQSDLNAALNAKQNSIATGTTSQYFRGDLSLAAFPQLAQSASAVAHQWLSAYSATTGLFTLTQPASTDLTDSAALARLASPTFTGTVTIPILSLSGITGSAQCLQVNSSGIVSGTGSACGAGGSGLGDPAANGIVTRTSLNITTARTITAGSAQITITNGNGVSGNPTIDVGTVQHANIAATAVTPGTYTNANIIVAADGSITAASNGPGNPFTTNHAYTYTSGTLTVDFSTYTSVTVTPSAGGVNPTLAFTAPTSGLSTSLVLRLCNFATGTPAVWTLPGTAQGFGAPIRANECLTNQINYDSTTSNFEGPGSNFTPSFIDFSGQQPSALAKVGAGGSLFPLNDGSFHYLNPSLTDFAFFRTGVDANPVTGQVTATHLAAPLPVNQGGTGVTSAQGNGTKVQLSTGATTTNDCVKFDANGNTVDAGAACGSGTGGGTGNAASVVTTTFSATPTFTCPSSSAGTVTVFKLSTALTANITSSTLASCTSGQTLVFQVAQDATGGRTIAWPSGFDGVVVSPTAGKTSTIAFSWDGTNAHQLNSSTDTASVIFGVERAAPATPTAGNATCWPDSTDHAGLECMVNASGTVYTMFSKSSSQINPLTGTITSVPQAAIPAVPTVIDTTATVTVSTTLNAEMHYNENATAATAITYNLPTAAAGKQFCFDNAYNGSAANTGALKLLTSASGQFIIFTDGTLSATGGYVISGGAAHDAACVAGVDSTHWAMYTNSGTWTKH